jgi:hypothetical protein
MWAILALTLAAGAGACSASGGYLAPPALSATSATPSAAATLSTAAARTAARPGTAAGSLPAYQPSKVVSEASGHTLLSTADSVSKVTRFYENALKDQGWRIVSTAKTAARATIVAMHGTRGAGILISSAGPAGTSISVFLCAC